WETARRFPTRLGESGSAGGAILATFIAAECGENKVLSFDMGGTTAKICLIENQKPQASRSFEVDRAARFLRGSGLPLRIPVIEMVEIGAGGGSLAHVDAMGRIAVGPESAGAEPGPACYGRGGTHPPAPIPLPPPAPSPRRAPPPAACRSTARRPRRRCRRISASRSACRRR